MELEILVINLFKCAKKKCDARILKINGWQLNPDILQFFFKVDIEENLKFKPNTNFNLEF